ncbi:MAG: hypothetical protein OEZ22_13045 [Spirochaetia bacterium]|nr:hypothetical protein [Spirochaetia bacterium]
MKRMLPVFILKTILILLISIPINAEEPKKRIAVMPFDFSGNITKDEAKYLTEKVRSALIQTRKYEVISNDQIETMMAVEAKKQGVGPGSCSSEQCIIDLGNALECEKMLVGSAGEAFGEYSINAKVLDVVLQQYENAADVSVASKNEFPTAAKEVVKKITGENYESSGDISYTGMLWRNALVPGWGHLYANQTRGYIYLALFAGAGGAFIWSHLNFTSKQDDYKNAIDDFDAKYETANSANSLRAYMSYAFISVIAAAVTDIAISGGSYKSRYFEPVTSIHPSIRLKATRDTAFGQLRLRHRLLNHEQLSYRLLIKHKF